MRDDDSASVTRGGLAAAPPTVGAAALVLAALAVPVPIGGGPSATPDPAPGVAGQEAAATVEMTNGLTFTPDSVVIRPGESVLFRNTSALVHTVTADPSRASLDASVRLPEGAAAFDSGRMKPGQSFTHTFETPGRYRYFCVPHEGARMRGTVVVREGG